MKRRALITGGAGGMGRSCGLRMGHAGYAVVLADVVSAPLESACAELNAAGIAATSVVCDVADGESVEKLAAALATGPKLDAVIHTAGLSPTMADWRPILAVDFVGTAKLLDATLPLIAEGGAAVCIASMAGHLLPEDTAVASLLADPLAPGLLDALDALPGRPVGDPGAAYSHAKRAVRALVAQRATAWGERGARIVSLSPGIITTPMGNQEFEQQPAMAEMLRIAPLKRLGDPDEIAKVVAFLCSEEASYITGCDILVDGGVTAALGALH